MKIKTGDNVKVLSGKDRGKTGKVIQVLRHKKTGEALAVVEGVNVRAKHLRPRKKGEKGQTLQLSAPLSISKLMFIDPATNHPTRVGFRFDGDVKKRMAVRTGEFIAS